MATALYSHESGHAHVTPPGHPERVARLETIERVLEAPEFAELDQCEAPLAADAEILRCHPEAYLAALRKVSPDSGHVSLDGDTHMSPGSLRAALHAVGGCSAAVDAVMGAEASNAFVACRPPGHHAETATPKGFCLFGTAAIAVKRALDHHGLSRVALVDFDVHHGNGSQALLWEEPRALFVSSHQSPLWPGSGARDERGGHDNVVNLPLDPMTGTSEMRRAYERVAFPAIEAFAPELILVSAGFDAHAADPLANLNWTEADFTWITSAICDLADAHSNGRVVSTLEGGYDLDALGASVAAHVRVLMERGG
ncbi:MAG: histone deacetylase family protein [Pseudomonadota bacterium]